MIRLAHNTPDESGVGRVITTAAEVSSLAEWDDPLAGAACRSHAVDMTAHIEGDYEAQWKLERHQKSVCKVCPVQVDCVADLVRHHHSQWRPIVGVWAGMTEADFRRKFGASE